MTDSAPVRRRIVVTGVVQGVGFRPFVHRLATAHGLAGLVSNTPAGVHIEIEGPPPAIAAFEVALSAETPPLARIHGRQVTGMAPTGAVRFDILPSLGGPGRSGVPPDTAMCDACLHEMTTSGNRRFRHPFISCSDCGPRYTIIDTLPYDRGSTSMAPLPMCETCAAEYETPGDRRFHAETIACPQCGPRLWLTPTGDAAESVQGEAALSAACNIVAAGGVVGVKGVGAFHLVCDAANAAAVTTLRRRKGRPDKPLALLVADLAHAERLAELSPAACRLLESPQRPVVLLPRRAGSDLAPGVAPEAPQIGIMLPPSPLHALLSSDWAARVDRGRTSAALVMTSANRSEEPAIVDDGEAWVQLAPLVEALVVHDRRIIARCDDSVWADAGSAGVIPVRRSRGYSPAAIPLRHAGPPVLAVGGELKAACCLAFDGQAVIGPHVGDMANADTLDAMSAGVDHFCRVLGVEPQVYVCDAHPGYLSSRWADDAAGARAMRVQHHHAHAASLMAEHAMGLDTSLLTVVFDGTGFGDDGAIWGGEVLLARYDGFRRLAHLAYAPLPGGDAAIRHPARAALAYLSQADLSEATRLPFAAARPAAERRLVEEMLANGTGVVATSSMGRLFDVVAALTGGRGEVSYEAQAALELEARAWPVASGVGRRYRFDWTAPAGGGAAAIGWVPVVRAIVRDVLDGIDAGMIATAFHQAVADLIVEHVPGMLSENGPRVVGLTGGVFQNVRLLGLTVDGLHARGIAALTHHLVPPNDGGLSLGQAAIGCARLRLQESS